MKTAAQSFEDDFLDDTEFSESGIYHDKNGIAKSIPLVIFRNKYRQNKQYGDGGKQVQVFSYDIEVRISRGDLGISSVTPGLETIEIPLNDGDVVLSSFNVLAIVMQDRGSFRLGLKR
ncbi:MAG: hypothetical protein PHN88_14850 [Ignavibacteria bacterium]|nr:hypothetical protein [Ignavibacteria bacterium]